MSEDKKINAAKLSDEALDGVNGGMMLAGSGLRPNSGLIGDGARKMPYSQGENAALRTTEYDEKTMDGKVHLMNNGVRSTTPNNKYKNHPGGNITNA